MRKLLNVVMQNKNKNTLIMNALNSKLSKKVQKEPNEGKIMGKHIFEACT